VPALFSAMFRPVGDPGTAVQPVPVTTRTTSFDGALTPVAPIARILTKYVPMPTPELENDVAVFPVEKLARLAVPGVEPASMM
jgi:hypothetical protein